MALGAATGNREGGLAIMTGATGLTFGHICHGHTLASTVGEGLGVAIRTFVGCSVEVMAEVTNHGATAVFKGQVGRFVASVALVAITG